MNNYEKLDNAIDELEKQSTDLKEFNIVYKEIISDIKSDILNNLTETNEKNKEISVLVKEVKDQLESTKVKIDEIHENNKYFQKELDSSIFSRLEIHKSNIQVEIRDAVTLIQKSLETTMNSKFTEMESKFKAEFEETKTLIQDKLIKIDSRLENEFINQAKKLKAIIILSSIMAAISVGIIFSIYFVK